MATQEAVFSNRIEGTRTTMEEVLQFRAGRREGSEHRQYDFEEVLNYRTAMYDASRLLNDLPLCLRVLRQAHERLLAGVRGRNRNPGEFRAGPNWIGPPGCTIDEAWFVPPPANLLPDAMSAWEKYMHDPSPLDQLVQLAILHAEFEALHPFQDGNGRLGRLFVPLFMWQHDLIRRPVFYISYYLDSHRAEYYERLRAVSRDDDWTEWSCFFLRALQAQAEDNTNRVREILGLYDDMKAHVEGLTRSPYTVRFLDAIFSEPIFTTTEFIEDTGVTNATAHRALKLLSEGDVIDVVEKASGRRPALYAFEPLLDIVERDTVVW